MPDTINFENSVPILRVNDLAASIAFYSDLLGFKLDWGGPNGFACVSRGKAGIYLAEGGQGHPGSWVWIGVGDAEKLFDEYVGKNARVRCAPSNFPWALEFQVEDPDGNVLRCGSDPLDGEPQGEWRDMKGDYWLPKPEGGRTRMQPSAAAEHFVDKANQARQDGKLKQARWSLFNAVELLRRHGSKEDLARTLRGLGELERVPFPAQGQRHYEEAIALFRELNDRWPLAQALGHLAMLHQDAGRVEVAGPMYEEAMSICRRSDGIAPLDYANTANRLAKFKHEAGNDTEAEPLWEAAHAHYIRSGIFAGAAGAAANLALVAHRRGDQPRSRHWLARAEGAAQDSEDPQAQERVAEVRRKLGTGPEIDDGGS